MKLTLSQIEFQFRDELSNDIKVIFSDAPRPANKTKGHFYNAMIFKNGQEIGGFLTENFANKSNASDLAKRALERPIV